MPSPAFAALEPGYHRTSWALLLRGLLALAVGLFVVVRPLESVAALALVIAFWALFSGIVEIVHAFELASTLNHWWVLLLSGLLSAGFGIAALYWYPLLSLTFAVLWIAWWFLFTGALGVFAAYRHKKAGLAWAWTMAFGVIGILAGAFALVAPPVTIAALMGLIGGFALVAALVLIGGAFQLKKLAHG